MFYFDLQTPGEYANGGSTAGDWPHGKSLVNPRCPPAANCYQPSKRVVSCMAALQDGTYLILNGGQQGVAGFGTLNQPNRNAVLYDPSKPRDFPMSVMANSTIDSRQQHGPADHLPKVFVFIGRELYGDSTAKCSLFTASMVADLRAV